jgi:hypothetical protein
MDNNLLFKVLEAQPNKISAFDYLKDPLERNNLKALLRMYDLIPLLAQTILDEMIDRLKEGNLYTKNIKRDYPKITSWLTESSRQAINRYKEDETEHGFNTVIGEYELQLKMIDELSRKVLPHISKESRNIWSEHPDFYDLMSKGRIKAFVKKYISLLSLIEEITSTESLIEFKKSVIDRCIPMGQLEVGQTFMFPQPEHAMDDGGQMFTYAGLFEEDIPNSEDKSVVCHYRKISDSIHVIYIEHNCLRAVMPY